MKLAIKFAGGLLAFLVVAFVVGLIWSNTRVAIDVGQPDPAVAYLNAQEPSGAAFREAYFEHDGNRLHYVEAGAGEEMILFLHGFPSYWLSLSTQMQALKDRYRVVAIDGLGAGRSDAPLEKEEYELERMSAHVIALLDHLEAKKVHLVGHDWGSVFAFGIAQRHPQHVSSVTGIAAPPINVMLSSLESDPVSRERAGYIERLKSANAMLVVLTGGHKRVWAGAYEPLVKAGHMSAAKGKLFREATGNPRRIDAHINWYRANIPSPDALKESDFWPSRDARITMPAQMIWGEDDPIFVASYDEGLLRIADDLRIRKLPDTGHWPHAERADQVTAAIAELIESAGGEQTPIPPSP